MSLKFVVLFIAQIALALAVPISPQTFEATVDLSGSMMPFPITGTHMYIDFPRGMQRTDTSMWGQTMVRIDDFFQNVTYIVNKPAGEKCRACFTTDYIYPMQVPILSVKTGEETLRGELCEVWVFDMGTGIRMTFHVQKAAPYSILRMFMDMGTPAMPQTIQFDYYGIRVGPIPFAVFNPNSTCTEPKCKAALELVLLIDGSGSVSPSDFTLMKQFANEVVKQFSIGNDEVHVSIIQFSDRAYTHIDLSPSMSDVQRAISGMTQVRSSTNMDAGLKAAYSSIITKGRSGVNTAVVMFTDGVPDAGNDPVAVANNMKKNNIDIFTVGVGNGVDPILLKKIASEPIERHAFLAASFSELQKLLSSLVSVTCKGDTCINGY